MLLNILLATQIVISIALTGVVLLQRSEGGALGMGGGPTGFMTARGAGNLLTTITWWLGFLFAACAIALTIAGNMEQSTRSSFDADEIGSAVGVPTEGASPAAPAAPAAPPTEGGQAPSLDNLPVGQGSAPAETPAP